MKVLIAYDASPPSEAAIDDLARAGLPRDTQALVLVVADVWPPPVGSTTWEAEGLWAQDARDQAARAVTDARSLASRAADRLRSLFPSWSVLADSVPDSPHAGIVHKAELWPANLILLGSHSRSALQRLALGSVSHNVVTHAHCSVRVGRHREGPPGRPLKLLLGVDGSPDSLTALRTVCARDWPPGSEVLVLTALDSRIATMYSLYGSAGGEWVKEHDVDQRQWIARIQKRAVEDLSNHGLHARALLSEEDARYALLEQADQLNADCIFVGARGLRGLRRFLLGSVSGAVATRAHCSVEVCRTNENAHSTSAMKGD